MALTYSIVYEFEDDSGDVGTTEVNIPTSFALADYIEFGQGMATFLDNITSGIIRSAALAVDVDLSSVTNNTAAVGSDVEELGSFQYSTAQNRRVQVNVAGLIETTVLPNSDDLDVIGNANVAAFNNAMLNGIAVTAGTIIPCDVGSDDLTSLVYAREAFRSSGVRR